MRKLSVRALVISLLLSLTSCASERLHVHTDYLIRERLASYRVHTPDPALSCPTEGQRLHIRWNLRKGENKLPLLHLRLTLRFYNHQEAGCTFPIDKRRGEHLYGLFNDDFFETKGIQTYKVELFSGECLLDTWSHQLWAERIEFKPQDSICD